MHTPRRPADTRKKACCALLIGCLLLQGCGRSNPEPPPDILKAQREAMDKAKSTDKMLQDAVERRDAQLESQAK
jgi:PBP1b-binding outer membrane lipoprotein LpoB